MKKVFKVLSLILIMVFILLSAVAASAYEEGKYVCPRCGTTDCGMSIGDIVVSATCTHGDYYHVDCGKYGDFAWLEIGDVNPNFHMSGEFIKSVEATCTEEGYDLYYCSDCRNNYMENYTAPLHPSGHVYNIDRNCESDCIEYYCTICHHHYTEPKTPTAHRYEAVSTDCTASYTDYVCSVCEDLKREAKTAASHIWSEWTTDVAATCTKEGKASRVCTVCDAGKEEKVLPKAEHSWTDWAVIQAPTETKAGQKIRTCTVCKENQTDIIPAGTTSGIIRSVVFSDITMNYKSTAAVKPVIDAENGAVKKVEYSSSTSDIVSVDDVGIITAHKTGSAEITVTVTDKDGLQTKTKGTVTVKYAWWQWIVNILLLGFLWY